MFPLVHIKAREDNRWQMRSRSMKKAHIGLGDHTRHTITWDEVGSWRERLTSRRSQFLQRSQMRRTRCLRHRKSRPTTRSADQYIRWYTHSLEKEAAATTAVAMVVAERVEVVQKEEALVAVEVVEGGGCTVPDNLHLRVLEAYTCYRQEGRVRWSKRSRRRAYNLSQAHRQSRGHLGHHHHRSRLSPKCRQCTCWYTHSLEA